MVKKILLVIVAAILFLLGYAALQSPNYVIAREITIHAPAEKVFPYLNNTKLADKWGPWKDIDPDAQMTLSGPEEGVGAKSSWKNGKQLGTGSATIVESVINQRVAIKLEYVEPMPMVQDSEYLLATKDGISTVTWKVRGQNTFMGRLMCVFLNMDKLVGGMFEKGLGNLKQLVETSP